MSAIDEAAEQLRSRPVADVGKLLRPAACAEIEREIARLAGYEPARPRGGGAARRGPGALARAVGSAGLRQRRDLLLLFNGRDWAARGWDLDPVADPEGARRGPAGPAPVLRARLTLALTNLARATGREAEKPRSASSSLLPGLPGRRHRHGVAFGWVVMRRRRARAGAAAEPDRGPLVGGSGVRRRVLATEEMSGPEAASCATRPPACAIRSTPWRRPTSSSCRRQGRVADLARLRQMENELEALRSSVLQAKRRP
jgi:hypothetical protein